MANKKKVNKVEAEKSEKMIRYVAIAVILIVIGIIAWPYIPKPQPQTNAANAGGNGPACAVFDSIAAADQYSEAPPMLIDESKQYFATVKMANGGQFVIELYPDKAPITVNSFVFLACKGFFNGVTFHRVLEGFMAQGGDPTGTGSGGPGYQFGDEFSDLVFDKPGLLAMANTGPNTNGSQFFITFAPVPHLNGLHSIFGEVAEGIDVVNNLTLRDPNQGPTFEGDAIESVTISEQ